jgi:hypothetical protein
MTPVISLVLLAHAMADMETECHGTINYARRGAGVARHSETEEEYVVYRALYDDRGLWIRPTAMFLETVVVDGHSCPRFQFLAAL